jgi:hypothetical protein
MHLPIINYTELNDGQLKQLATTAAFDVVFANAELVTRRVRQAFGWPLWAGSVAVHTAFEFLTASTGPR